MKGSDKFFKKTVIFFFSLFVQAWKGEDYNNMANYWEENIGFQDAIGWQDLDTFQVFDWSSLLYSFPVPDYYL